MRRVALLTPFAAPSVGGNAVTVGRIARGLRHRGLDVRVWDLSATPPATIDAQIEGYRPDLMHAFHARRAGPLALDLASRLEVPLVVTLTGTDANHHLIEGDGAAPVRRVLDGASLVTAFHESIVEQVVRIAPALRSRLLVVPQSVNMGAAGSFVL